MTDLPEDFLWGSATAAHQVEDGNTTAARESSGYLHRSAFDNVKWSDGYRPRSGLIAVERDKDYAHIPEPSAHAFARVAATGRLPSSVKEI